MEDKWAKLEEIVERVVEKVVTRLLDERELKKKTPLRFENGQWIGITKEQLNSWQAAYGLVDIDMELKRAAAWLASNREKSPKNFARFVNAWLLKQQERSSIRSIPTRNEQIRRDCAYCEKPSVGSVNGIWHCSIHSQDAMDQLPRKTA